LRVTWRFAVVVWQCCTGTVTRHSSQLRKSRGAPADDRMAAARRRAAEAYNAVFFVCDVQERFAPLVHRWPAVVHTSRTLVRAAAALNSDVVVTEQYPKALGRTAAALLEALPPGAPVFAKTRFSMLTREVEAHVCVQQTALDLLDAGKRVFVVADGVSSQRPGDRTVALQALAAAGATVTTLEGALFALMRDAAHPAFKAVSRLCVEHHEGARALQGGTLDHLA